MIRKMRATVIMVTPQAKPLSFCASSFSSLAAFFAAAYFAAAAAENSAEARQAWAAITAAAILTMFFMLLLKSGPAVPLPPLRLTAGLTNTEHF
jgi:hypothetical protein